MKVALELQPCCGRRSGIGVYTYELAKRLRSENGLEFCGNLFNFAGRNDNTEALKEVAIPIRESRMFPYGVYRRIWDIVPVSYDSLFPGKADLTIFFNYIVPPRIKGDVMTAVHDVSSVFRDNGCPEFKADQTRHPVQRRAEQPCADDLGIFQGGDCGAAGRARRENRGGEPGAVAVRGDGGF